MTMKNLFTNPAAAIALGVLAATGATFILAATRIERRRRQEG